MLYKFQHRNTVYEISLDREGDSLRATVDGEAHAVELLDAQPGQLSLRFDGRPLTLYWAADGATRWVSLDGCTYRLDPPASRAARSARGSSEPGGAEAVRSPMPASVRAVQVQAGDTVAAGQTLLLLEAMKMEIRLRAPQAGQVVRLHVAAGQTVEKDQLLVEIGE